MASMKFKAWLRDYLRQVADGVAKLTALEDERIKTYLALVNHGYTKEDALAIMDLYMEQEEEA